MSEPDKAGQGASGGTHAAGAGAQGARSAPGSADLAVMPGAGAVEDQRLDELLPLGVSPLATKGPGRPLNAKNRRSDLVATYLVERFGDPLTATASIAGRPLRDLVTELRKVASDCGMKLGATVMDIARWQQQCRVDALPYIHAKRAPETARGDPVVPVLGIGRVDRMQVVVQSGPARSLEEAVAEAQQDQTVITIDQEVSHDGKSHDEG